MKKMGGLPLPFPSVVCLIPSRNTVRTRERSFSSVSGVPAFQYNRGINKLACEQIRILFYCLRRDGTLEAVPDVLVERLPITLLMVIDEKYYLVMLIIHTLLLNGIFWIG